MRSHLILSAALSSIFLASCGGGGGGGGGGVSAEAQIQSAQQTQTAASSLFSGSEDFQSLTQSLQGASNLNPQNASAQVLLGLTRFLQSMDNLAVRPGGRVRNLYSRAGYLADNNVSGFWNFDIDASPAFGQGTVIDTMPTAQEFAQSIELDVLPALSQLADTLEGAPASFRWLLSANELNQHPSSNPTSPISADYELDYGDLQMLASAVHVAIAAGNFVLAYEQGNVQFNDFDSYDYPTRNGLEHIRDVYPNLGNVARTSMLAQCRDRLERASAAYGRGSAHIRNETPAQQAAGLLTIAPGRLLDPTQVNDALQQEQNWRAWIQGIVANFRSNAAIPIRTGPDGTQLPTNQQLAISFGRFFAGINMRDLWLKLVTDPFTNKVRVGVTSLSQVTPAMLSLDGTVTAASGPQISIGDMQNGRLTLRVDSLPLSIKTIDGNFSDWSTGFVKLADAPRASVGANGPNLGNLYASVSSNRLFLRLDANLQQVVDSGSGGGDASVEVAFRTSNPWPEYAGIDFWDGSPQPYTYGSGIQYYNGASGFEWSCLLPSSFGALWAEVTIRAYLYDSMFMTTLENERSRIYIRVR